MQVFALKFDFPKVHCAAIAPFALINLVLFQGFFKFEPNHIPTALFASLPAYAV